MNPYSNLLLDAKYFTKKCNDNLEQYFAKFKKDIIGEYHAIKTPYHDSIRLLYTDWTASGRMFLPIEKRLQKAIYPLIANTHSETNDTGTAMTYAYEQALSIIKQHVGASHQDVLISSDSGMTGVVNKFQRILGLRVHEKFRDKLHIHEEERPVVFISHMEHHSNQISWIETVADVVIVPPDQKGLFSLENFKDLLYRYQARKMKIAAITACSNVTGINTPYLDIAELIHRHKGYCFVDFACSAPYEEMNMHPNDTKGRYLDAIYFSAHKFLGGPGSTGILVFNRNLYNTEVPDHPGGGTVNWTNPWGAHSYMDNIELREDGGTPPVLQTIKAAMCMQLKDEMGVDNIRKRKEELLNLIWDALDDIPNLTVLAGEHRQRSGVISFYIDGLHHNVGVKLLNDKFGIQMRGGCSCAGTYGHYLLQVSPEQSRSITSAIDQGDASTKPGWIRMSIHPTLTNNEVHYLLHSLKALSENHADWIADYDVNLVKNWIKPKDRTSEIRMRQDLYHFWKEPFATSERNIPFAGVLIS